MNTKSRSNYDINGPALIVFVLLMMFVPTSFSQHLGKEEKTIQGGILNGKAISLPSPEYPANATNLRVSGSVNVKVTVDTAGNVVAAKAVSGNSLLRESAEKAAWKARLKPTILGGSPVRVEGTIVYNFKPETPTAVRQTSDSSTQYFPDINAFLKDTLKSGDNLDFSAEGDLNGDGVKDWTGVIWGRDSEKMRNGDENSYSVIQLFILLKQKQGGYKIAGKTERQGFGGMGCCFVEDLKIRRSSVFVKTSGKTASSVEEMTAQFRLLDGNWRMIGLKIRYDDLGLNEYSDTDFNVLTGFVVETIKRQKRKAEITRSRRSFGEYFLRNYEFAGFGIKYRMPRNAQGN